MVVVREEEHAEPAANLLCFLGIYFSVACRLVPGSPFFLLFLKQVAQGVSTICMLDKTAVDYR